MINFFKYLDQQSSEDKRAFIVHYPAKSGKTSFAKRAAMQRADIFYLDLQETFLKQPDLPQNYSMRVRILEGLFIGIASDGRVYSD